MKNGKKPCGCDDCKKKAKSKCSCGGQDSTTPAKKLTKIDSNKSLAYQIAYLEALNKYS